MPEHRVPRDQLARRLARICERLDVAPVRELPWRLLNFRDAGTYAAERLWVFGSFARGAALCGDLDLLLDAKPLPGSPGLPHTSTVKSHFIGSAPRVRMCLGTPDNNSAEQIFAEAKLIWTAGDSAWRQRIAEIQTDPEAGRFQRTVDQIPFRDEQVGTGYEWREKLIQAREQGLIDWRFVELSQIKLDAKRIAEEAALYDEKVFAAISLQTKRLQPYLFTYLQRREAGGWWSYATSSTRFWRSGSVILVGRSPVPDIALLDEMFVTRVLVMPYLTSRGPNGIWILRRGKKHPFVRRASTLRAYCLLESDGIFHTLVLKHSHVGGRGRFFSALPIFTRETLARSWIAKAGDRFAGHDLSIIEIRGRAVLELVSEFELAILDGEDRAIAPELWSSLGERLEAEELFSRFR